MRNTHETARSAARVQRTVRELASAVQSAVQKRRRGRKGSSRRHASSVEHMPSKRVTFGQGWMIEVVLRVARHTELLHHAPRPEVVRHGKRHDLPKAQGAEARLHGRPGRLGRVALAPVLRGQSPADLHARRKPRLEARRREPNEAGAGIDPDDLECPAPEPSLLEMRLDLVHQRIALLARERVRKKLSHSRVGVDKCETTPISGDEAPEQQTLGSKLPGQKHRAMGSTGRRGGYFAGAPFAERTRAPSPEERFMIHEDPSKKFALITGASSGIGKEIARLHASRGGDVVLVARSADKLAELAAELHASHGIRVTVFAKDLIQPSAPQEVYDGVKAAGIEVDYLVNNAGFGGQGAFHERPWADDLSMIQLNVVALTALTRLFVPDFVARRRGRILNVSSTASLMAGPLQAVYYATKAYVTSFSNAIAEELRGTGVTVTALLPGATETEFAQVAEMDKTPLFANTRLATAAAVARAGYEGMLAGRLDVIAGVTLGQRLMLSFVPFMPKSVLLRQVHAMQER